MQDMQSMIFNFGVMTLGQVNDRLFEADLVKTALLVAYQQAFQIEYGGSGID
jgi:hypothetical protein